MIIWKFSINGLKIHIFSDFTGKKKEGQDIIIENLIFEFPQLTSEVINYTKGRLMIVVSIAEFSEDSHTGRRRRTRPSKESCTTTFYDSHRTLLQNSA